LKDAPSCTGFQITKLPDYPITHSSIPKLPISP
jgi:hypothetical protein